MHNAVVCAFTTGATKLKNRTTESLALDLMNSGSFEQITIVFKFSPKFPLKGLSLGSRNANLLVSYWGLHPELAFVPSTSQLRRP
jgi:hypothetical protein